MKNREIIKTRFRRNTAWRYNTVLDIAERNNCTFKEFYTTPYDNTILIMDCTMESYMAFAREIDMIYPGVCDFDVATIYTLMTRKG